MLPGMHLTALFASLCRKSSKPWLLIQFCLETR